MKTPGYSEALAARGSSYSDQGSNFFGQRSAVIPELLTVESSSKAHEETRFGLILKSGFWITGR